MKTIFVLLLSLCIVPTQSIAEVTCQNICNTFELELCLEYKYGTETGCVFKAKEAKAILDKCSNIKEVHVEHIKEVFGPIGHDFIVYTKKNGKSGIMFDAYKRRNKK